LRQLFIPNAGGALLHLAQINESAKVAPHNRFRGRW
jgi:hypothetical protein